MNVRKRGLALLMCICMIFTLLPFSAFADGEESYNTHSETGGVVMDKTVKHVSGDKYKVTLEQYVKGNVTPGTTTPIDVVLVLDVSGSMDEGFGEGDAAYVEEYNPKQSSNYTYYIKDANGRYTGVSWCSKCEEFTDGCTWFFGHVAGNKYTPMTSAEDIASDRVQFFSSNTKITALKSAVNSFIDVIAKDNPTSKIAIVKFAGDITDNVGNDTYKEGRYTYNHTQIVQNLTEADTDGAASLKAAVNALTASGATAADYGLEKAIDVFGAAGQVPKDRNRVVIMFTDGQPNHYNGFDGSVADTAIENAQTLKSKSYGASVYTIGIFSGANVGTTLPDNDNSGKTNRYMHLVSSNYPNASSMSEPGTDGDVKNGYYKVASDAESLGSVFTKLGEAIGKPSITLGSNAVLTDNIAPNFNVPGNISDVKVFTADYDGKSKTFGDWKEFTTGDVKISGNAVTVSGFNYSANFVSDTEHPGTTGNYGKKLIVEFDITVDRTQTYGGTQPANAGANITLDGETIASVDYPPVPVSIVNDFGTSYKKSKTYNGEGFTIKDEFEAMLKNDNIADGEKNDYVNITYTVIDEKGGIVGTYVIEANKTTGTWTAGSAAAITSPDVGTYNYKVTCVVSDVNKENGAESVTKSGTMTLSITPITDEVVVTITGNHAEKVYNGAEQSVEGFTTDVGNKAITVTLKEGSKAEAKGTNVDKYMMGLSEEDFNVTSDNYSNIKVVVVDGYLEITPITDEVVVTITGNHAEKVYNGAEQSVEGFTTDVGNKAITVTLKEGSKAEAKGTNVDKYMMGLSEEDFNVTSDNYSNIKVVVVDGYLDITPITDEVVVTITGNHDSKVYNGTEQSVTGFTTDVGNKAITVAIKEGYEAVASGTDVGNYKMGLTKDYFAVTSDAYSNIKVVVVDGYLDITPITDEVVVTITGHKDEFTYDGKEHTVKGYETSISNQLYKATDFTFTGKAEVSRTKVGTSDMGLKNDHFQNASDNFTNVKFVINDGSITIKERPYIPPVNPPITDKITVEITGNSDSVVYDGTEHSVKDYTVKISDSRYTEKDFTFSGKALASGVNAGTYEMGLKADQFKNTNARFTNVEFIIKADGVLTITQRPLTITAGSAEGIAPVTCDKYTVEGLATGDKVDSVKITGIQSEPGESPNVASDAVIKNAKGEDVTANYKITYVNGVLKAIEVLNKEIHFNYVIGYTDGTIRPNNDISRAEVATIFFRLLTDEARTQYTTTAGNFTDVKAGMWCNRAIATLTNMGIIKGYTDGSFQPNADITRAELATIIARFAKLDVNTKTFSDINGHWAQKNIELAAGNGWINGYEDGTFRPNNNITRAETFAMINRVLDRQTESVSDLLPTSEMNMWSDNLNENAWYYKDVQEATNYHKCDRVGDSVYEKWTEKVPDIDWASYQI